MSTSLSFLKKNPRSLIAFECVDMDEKAIDFATVVCDNNIDSISFKNENVFNVKSTKNYDLIWSAGLFDYFNEKLFISLLRRYFQLLNKGGEMVIASFSKNNPSKGIMEVLCQWQLQHRSGEELIDLSIQAGIPKENIEVKSENMGINLFLHVLK